MVSGQRGFGAPERLRNASTTQGERNIPYRRRATRTKLLYIPNPQPLTPNP